MRAVLEWAAAKDLYPNYPHGIWDQIAKALGKNIKDSERAHHGGQQVGCRRQSYRMWVTPDSRMKAKKEHRVPLTVRGLEILSQAQELTKRSPLIFCHPKTKKPFSNGTSTSLLHKGLGCRTPCTDSGHHSGIGAAKRPITHASCWQFH